MFDNLLSIFKKRDKNKEEKVNKEKAKERLHLVLMQDRANVSADFLDLMKQEIIDVIKKYIDVDEEQIDVKLTNKLNGDGTTGAPALYANIPIKSIKKEIRMKTNKDAKSNISDDKKDEESSIESEEKVENIDNKQDEIIEKDENAEILETTVENEATVETIEKDEEIIEEKEVEDDKTDTKNVENDDDVEKVKQEEKKDMPKKDNKNKGKKKKTKTKETKKSTTFFENISVEDDTDTNKTEE
ncbi:MAG: cell division topological specificity factor MinE [Clostridia bacterium]|nr:cell division topological specificity factor MinE [Clostridia bacterium]